jgi:uncharacterized membrane protein YvbJ
MVENGLLNGTLEKDIKTRIRRNDIRWAVLILFIFIIFVRMYGERKDETERNLSAFKSEVMRKDSIFQDSLITLVNEEYCITKKYEKCPN